MKTVLAAVAVGFFGCNILCEQAKAAPPPPITGEIHFHGSATASGVSPGSPVTITFNNDLGNPSPAHWEVLDIPAPTGDFALVSPGTTAIFNSFSFTGDGAGASLSLPVIPEWSFSFGGINYSFDLTSLTNGHVGLVNGLAVMNFNGAGTLHATDFADTPASWSLDGTGESLNFIFSEAHNTAVPEGGVISLLALGFAMLAGKTSLRKRKTI